MEEPASFDADSVRIEKEKVLKSVVLPKNLDRHTARSQYAAGWQGGVPVVGYLQEEGIPDTSTTDTFAAIRLDVENRRWAGVPFYLRTGKRLGRRVTEIAVVFKRAPHLPFAETAVEELGQNAIVLRVQPDEGMTVRFGSKVPGTTMEVRDVNMDFQYGDSFTQSSPEAYERLILDVLLGDARCSPTRRGGDVLAHPRPGAQQLGEERTAGPVHLRRLGPQIRLRDDGQRRTHLEAAMIRLEDTTGNLVQSAISAERHRLGATASGMVMTLLVLADEATQSDAAQAASFAAQEHPMRILVLVPRKGRSAPRLDAEISVGGDGGPGELAVLRMYGNWRTTRGPWSSLLLSPTPRWWRGGRTTLRRFRSRPRSGHTPSVGSRAR